jgi:hypothetical protein
MAAVEWPPVHDASAAEPGDRVGRHAYDRLAVDERCVENAFGFCWTGKQHVFVTCQMRSQLRTIRRRVQARDAGREWPKVFPVRNEFGSPAGVQTCSGLEYLIINHQKRNSPAGAKGYRLFFLMSLISERRFSISLKVEPEIY